MFWKLQRPTIDENAVDVVVTLCVTPFGQDALIAEVPLFVKYKVERRWEQRRIWEQRLSKQSFAAGMKELKEQNPTIIYTMKTR